MGILLFLLPLLWEKALLRDQDTTFVPDDAGNFLRSDEEFGCAAFFGFVSMPLIFSEGVGGVCEFSCYQRFNSTRSEEEED